MSHSSHDQPELTAYALGELDAGLAAEVHALLAQTPGTATELEQIEAVTDALRHGAPIVQHRLTPGQRHAVLRPSHLPRRMQPMMPRPPVPRRHPASRSFVVRLAQMAALIAIAGGAFLAGKYGSSGRTLQFGAAHPAVLPQAQPPEPAPLIVQPSKPTPEARFSAAPVQAPVVTPAPAPAPAAPEPAKANLVAAAAKSERPVGTPAAVPASSAPAATASSPAKAAPAAPSAAAAAAPQVVAKGATQPKLPPTASPSFGFMTATGRAAFVSASKRPMDQFNVRPASLRPAPVKAPGTEFASPAPTPGPASGNEQAGAKPRAPELYIHSWKAEVASCPWNEANRLLRVVVQLPADQPAAGVGAAYRLQINFDPNTVRDYRLLSERHMPAPELRSAGVHVIWYEFQPNGAGTAGRDSGRPIATVTLPNGRFTTQTVGPFDSSKLQVLDRGQSWQNAREDFLFESSIVGFGMLLRGTEEAGKLNHDMVLNLAEKGKGADTTGERGRFIRLVQSARKAAGL